MNQSQSKNKYKDKVVETKSDFKGIWKLITMSKETHIGIAISILLVFLGSLSAMISTFYLGKLVESLYSITNNIPKEVVYLAVYFLVFETLVIVFVYLGRTKLAKSTIITSLNVRQLLFNKLQHIPMQYFESQPLGRTLTRITTDVQGIENFFSNTLVHIFSSSIQLALVIFTMLYFDLELALFIILAAIPILLFSTFSRKPLRNSMRKLSKNSSKLNSKLAENINGINVIKTLGLEQWTFEKYKKLAYKYLLSSFRVMNINTIVRPLIVASCVSIILIIFWIGGNRVLDGTMSIAVFVSFLRLSQKFLGPVRTISAEIQNIQLALVAAERIWIMLSNEEEKDFLGKNGAVKQKIIGKVEFKDVWMAYDNDINILKGISFSAKQGMKIGLVGHTGSGKSSTINLLPKLYPINKGEINIDDINLDDWDRKNLRTQLGYVGQDVVIFSGTLRENLRAACNYDKIPQDDEILKISQQTGLNKLIDNFEAGLDHVLLPNGSNLSVGEKQLIAFTRMILKDPKILILDEATANIDENYEKIIQHATAILMRNRTCFIIAHRLSTLLECDLILVYNKGEIVESGTHAELLKLKKVYYNLTVKQL